MPPKATTSTVENVFGLRPNEIRLLLQGLAFVGSDGKVRVSIHETKDEHFLHLLQLLTLIHTPAGL